MDPEFISHLLAKRDELTAAKLDAERRLAALNDSLQRINEAVRLFQSPPMSSASRTTHESNSSHKRERWIISPREVGEQAKRLLAEAGRPMKRGALLKLFDQQGIPIVGGDRAKVLGTILWRLKDDAGKPLFVSTDNGYWPSDTDIPDA